MRINSSELLQQAPDRFQSAGEIIKIITALNFPNKAFAVCGGALMVIEGIKPSTHDIDLLVEHDFFEYIKKYDDRFQVPEFVPVSMCDKAHCLTYDGVELLDATGLTHVPNIHQYLTNARPAYGLRWVTPADTIEWKKLTGREKDLKDIELIEDWFLKHGTREF